METNKYKEALLEIIAKLDHEDQMVKYLENFVKTYDGTNINELVAFLLPVIGMINSFDEYKIKSKGYDDLTEVADIQRAQENELKKEFERVQQGEDIDKAFVSSD